MPDKITKKGYVKFDIYKFHCIQINGQDYISIEDISKFSDCKSKNIYSIITDLSYYERGVMANNYNTYNYNCTYIHHNFIIYIISRISPKKYLEYQEIIKNKLGYKVIYTKIIKNNNIDDSDDSDDSDSDDSDDY